ncbi:hypothetical protein BKA65DRAFT_39218 [Rhexocercosporidium sp. MPI-PUGE-AT-0058]|nr:hypothetical protein BKA65DRAFT_39218 [Rhexocercosporidium sp. MPI-PUGE-AT-0058]
MKSSNHEAVEGLALEQDLEISSPDHFYGSNQNHTDNDDSSITMRQDNTALPHGSVYSPQFCDPTASTLESLFRTLATIKTEQIKAYQGSTDQVQYTLDTQVAEANEMLHNEDDCTSVIRNSKGLLNRVDVPRQQVNVLPDVKSQAGPSSVIDVVSRDKHMSPTTNCTFDDTPTSGSSTPSSSGSWELLSRCGSFRHEDFALAKLQVLDPMRQALVERIIEEFSITYDQNWMCQTTQCGGGHPPTTKQLADCGSTGDIRLSPNSQNSCFKRQRNQDEDSADEDENRRQRKQGRRPANELSDSRRFSCPFRKHNPQKYSIHSHRVCALTGWDTIARVKEHLYRNHKAAHYCKRCWNVFDTDDLKDQHTTVPADLICEAVPGEPPEGVTPKQVSELRSRAKPYSKPSESERWNEIFRLLFPGVNIPSPYWEPVQDHVIAPCSSPNLMLYNDYIYRELPRLVRSRVEEIVCREMQPIEATIFASLEHLVRECQTQLSSTYREKLPIGHDISSNSELAPNLDTDELINAAEGPGIVQDSPVDCFASVHQPPSSLEDGYVDDFAASELQLFASTFPFDIQSDSEDVSISQCPGKTNAYVSQQRSVGEIQLPTLLDQNLMVYMGNQSREAISICGTAGFLTVSSHMNQVILEIARRNKLIFGV